MRRFEDVRTARQIRFALALSAPLAVVSVTTAQAEPHRRSDCRGNSRSDIMVRVGSLCVDKYEASVWSNPNGTGTQYPEGSPRFPTTFLVNGNWTEPLYAVSRKGVGPAVFLTWFQARQACELSGKRLLTAEWQMAAADSVSTPAYGNDSISGINEAFHLEAPQTGADSEAAIDGLPAALIGGGIWTSGPGAGVFAPHAEHAPSSLDNATGFRCARSATLLDGPTRRQPPFAGWA